ncbi:hypothetical protein NMY22_g13883 [Coprinellus aureogranulatus]|nr:hypothetical protein NMY22_g13883 [Coprinellus aureogranulatus]
MAISASSSSVARANLGQEIPITSHNAQGSRAARPSVSPGSLVADATNNRGERRPLTKPAVTAAAIPNTASLSQHTASRDHRLVAALPQRIHASSPSAVAMKSRRQREHYTGEGPVLRATQWQNHTVESFSQGQAFAQARSPAANPLSNYQQQDLQRKTFQVVQDHQEEYRSNQSSEASLGQSTAYTTTSFLNQSINRTQGNALRQSEMNSVRLATNFDYGLTSDTYSSFMPSNQVTAQINASQYSVPLYSSVSSAMAAHQDARVQASYSAPELSHSTPLSPLRHPLRAPGQAKAMNVHVDSVLPRIYAAPSEYCAESEWLRGFTSYVLQAGECDAQGLDQYEAYVNDVETQYLEDLGDGWSLDVLDPLHAPLKHLTDIVTPICNHLGISFEKLADLDGERRQMVTEKLLDEKMGEQDPFKAAMGLVMASKLGLLLFLKVRFRVLPLLPCCPDPPLPSPSYPRAGYTMRYFEVPEWITQCEGCTECGPTASLQPPVLTSPPNHDHSTSTTTPSSSSSFVPDGTLTPPPCPLPALKFRKWLGGEQAINDYCHDLAVKGGKRLEEILGTEGMDPEGEITLNMVNVVLPIPTKLVWSVELYEWLNKKLIEEHKTYSAWFKHGGKWWTRVSVQVFNDIDDFDVLGKAWKEVSKELEKAVEEGKFKTE